MIQETLRDITVRALKGMGMPEEMVAIQFDHPADTKFGDFSTNVAMLLSKQLGATVKTPFDLAEKIVAGIEQEIRTSHNKTIYKVEAVRPGFINFYLTKLFFQQSLADAIEKTAWYGKGMRLWNKKIIIEHTNLNPFKPFHIGHLVNNAIGESLSRILEWQDAKLTRASYGGDIGLHVAKTLWAIMKIKDEIPENAEPKTYIEILGSAYTMGNSAYEQDTAAQEEIKIINKKIFDKSDAAVNKLYEWGRDISLTYFKELYKRLDTRVDIHFFESEVAAEGFDVVMKCLAENIFEKSDGAIIYPGEKKGLHNRVFITSQGLPTYEAKEIGLTRKKFEYENFDSSIVVTANEQDDYFKVVLMAIGDIYPEIAHRTKHLSHGMLRFASGKMSSRKGNIITGESLIEDVEAMVEEKIKDRDYTEPEKVEIKTLVGRAAIKYSILKQSIGKDIIFNPEQSLSFEGDSGPYLQYSYVRARSILEKADKENIVAEPQGISTDAELPLERILYRFPSVIERASKEFAPQYIATYLVELAAAFNSYYASNKIVDRGDQSSPYKVALTTGVLWTLKNGLYLLGIDVPKRM
jgi:arginyl-tRNA synthetase